MKLATYCYHDLRYVWSSEEVRYVEREYDGLRGFASLFKPILDGYNRDLTLDSFIKPRLLYPNDEQSLDDAMKVYFNAQLWLQCSMYVPDGEGETFKGLWVQFDNMPMLDVLWNDVSGEEFRMAKTGLPYIASVTIILANATK